MRTAIIVPARLASTRFPQKLLHEIRGRPVLLWTADRIRRVAPEYPLWFAVDGERLRDLVTSAGYGAVVTDPAHTCGTDRIGEANRSIRAECVINVQGDEPLVLGEQIRTLARLIEAGAEMATLGAPIPSEEEYLDPNHVKLLRDLLGGAVYFSRAPVPHFRDAAGRFDASAAAACGLLIHLGLYAYRASFLEHFTSLAPGPLERAEKLEMLRAIEHGHEIAVGVSDEFLIEIDTPEQARQFERTLAP